MIKSVDSYQVQSGQTNNNADSSFVNSNYIQDDNTPLSSDDETSINENDIEVKISKLKIDYELEKSMIDMKYK